MEDLYILFLCLLVMPCTYGGSSPKCVSPQYLEKGKAGAIECTFQDDFYAISWYTAVGFSKQTDLVRLVNGETIGEGFSSGEFDIREDGSLIINNVTLWHETNYTAVIFQSQGENTVYLTVEALVVVKPSSAFPIIDTCQNESMCFTRLEQGVGITCYITNSRPAINLQWVTRTETGDVNISSQVSITSNDGWLFTSRALTREAFLHSQYLSLLVCKADSIPGMMPEDESVVLIENSEINIKTIEPIVKYAERHSDLSLSCSKGNISSVIWEKADLNSGVFRVLSYGSFIGEGYFKTYNNHYILQSDGSLLIPSIEANHEGLYRCVFENDNSGDLISFDVIIYVPAVPVVEGCEHLQECVLDADMEGSLNCSVKGIRPEVQLQWKTFVERESSIISFTDHQLTTTSNGDMYDVTLSSKYQLEDTSMTSILLKCATQSNADVLKSSAKVDLLFSTVKPSVEAVSPNRMNLLWILTIIALLCLLAIPCRLCVLKGRRRKRQRTRKGYQQREDMPMITTSTSQAETYSDLKIVFKRELKTKYKYQYDAVQPIPYIKDRLYCVDRVFVEGGFEKLISRDRIDGLGNWEKLTSYHEVTDMSSSSTRTIIEGDPGYGKSTLALQLAYDWCNCNANSPLAVVDILILLRLRQLGGVHSVFRAIKQFILPRDSQLNETDIQTILRESRSTVVILDGFDEYPEEETQSLTDFISIIRGEMFQESFVILTTRSFFLPKSYPPQSHRIRLTGFDSKARDAYICKAVVGDNTRAAEKIKRSLLKNSVLQGLCQVPLFFVMFAHMTHESEKFIKFKSVTSFFRHMIACFHSHMKNKMKDLNVKKLDLHENDHDSLDEVAFQGLSGKNQKIVWRRDDLVKRLGKEFYDQYRKIGILVEEEVLDVTDTPGDIRYDTEVRFYHKLFCEWYAAHCLCRKVVEPDANFPKILEHMNPFDLQYTYRFACGISSEAGNKIIEYLRGMKDGDKFAVLCLLEQSGKFDQIKETVQELCSNYITIYDNDSLLLQGSIVQLLEIGSSNQIPVSFVWLKDCFESIDLSAGSILLKSKLSISLPTLKELVIAERGRTLQKKEFSDVLEYSAMCPGLKSLRFCYLSMPKSVSEDRRSFLVQRKLQVLWCTDEGDYLLSHRSGEWEAYGPRASNNVIEGDISAKKNLLISLMKKKYNEVTAAVPIVPTHPDRLYNVNEIFVDSGLQYMVAKDKDESNRQWEPLTSYQNIFTGSHAKCKRHVLQGKPGFGKSMIALKMAYDWCNDIPQSPLSKVDLFLLVQLTLENSPKSIYTHLKRCVLPKDSPLSVIDIKSVLRECSSAVMVLDDFNLYGYEQTDEKNDVIQIIRGKMLKDIDVITTSTFVPKECMPATNRFQLTGFDDKARDEYVQKIVGDDMATCHRIKEELCESKPLKELLNSPLFVSAFVHVSKESNDLGTFNFSFTSFMQCLSNNKKNQGTGHNKDENVDFEIYHLDKIAFDCMCTGGGLYVFGKETLCNEVERKCYNKFLGLGILVETEVEEIKGASKRFRTEVHFCHELFGKWFAAHYVAKHAGGKESQKIKNALTKLEKSDIELIRYSVEELNVSALCKMLCWVEYMYDFDELSKLIFKHFDQAGSIVDVMSQLCSNTIDFNIGQEELLQKTRIHLLNIASDAKIPISFVWLKDCFNSIDLSAGSILLKSELAVPSLPTLKELVIVERGRALTKEEFSDVLEYSAMCPELKSLRFCYLSMPKSVSKNRRSFLEQRKLQVLWCTDEEDYLLSHRSGEWEAYDPRSSKNVIEGDIPAKKNLLISLMKKKYNEVTAAVPIVPTHPDRFYNVNEIFVDSGLQYMITKDKDESNRQWEPLNSYQNIFTGSHAKCKRHVLQGKPGYGKSMIALKMAYDWCNDIPQSPLSKVDLLLLVQLTLENTSKSIYTHLKRCILPNDSPLSVLDIKGVLRECSSAVMVLDDFNLYAYEQNDEKNDVIQIIRGKMLKDIDVITESTFVPKDCMPGTNKVRLTGFDDKARDVYINKVVVRDDAASSDSIMHKLRENHIFKELSSVPLFLSMFVQTSREMNDLRTLNTFNATFAWLMKFLQSHMKKQGKSHNEDEHFDVEKDHLDKVAFDCLCGSDGRYVLDKKTICKEVGKECYDKYLRLGILVEAEEENINSASNPYQREAQFYHELFCKWFAARYIAKHKKGRESETIKNALTKLDKSDMEHIGYFLGELDVGALGEVLCSVRHITDFDELLTKLIFEHFDQAASIVDVVSKLCSSQTYFENEQKKRLQKSRIHLLQIASEAKISISEVRLYKCYSTVSLSGGNHLQLKSNLSIPVLTTLNTLTIDTEDEGREITAEEFAVILQYSSKCLALKVLRFYYCLLPQSVQAESVSVLRSRNVKVLWNGLYQLNLQSCLWEYADGCGSGMITDEDYQKEVRKFREDREKREKPSQAT